MLLFLVSIILFVSIHAATPNIYGMSILGIFRNSGVHLEIFGRVSGKKFMTSAMEMNLPYQYLVKSTIILIYTF